MRLDFKRIMSSVLAFVMLFSSLVMVNVVSVSAADTPNTEEGTLTFENDNKTAKWDFSGMNLQSNITMAENGTIYSKFADGKTNDSYAIIALKQVSLKKPNDNCLSVGNKTKDTPSTPVPGKIAVAVPKDSSGTITIDASITNGRYFAVVEEPDTPSETKRMDHNTTTCSYTSDDIFDIGGKTYIELVTGNDGTNSSDTSAEIKPKSITITADKPYFTTEGMETYTITGSCSGDIKAGERFTLTDSSKSASYEAVVDDGDSTYTVTESAAEAPFGVGTTLNVSAKGYTVVPTQITLNDSGDGKKFTANEPLAFTNIPESKVSPSDTGYTWSGSGKLTTDSSYGGAYADKNTDTNYVEVGNGTAHIIDTNTNSATGDTTLIMPVPAAIAAKTTGTVTYSAKISNITGGGNNWSIFDLKDSGNITIAALRTNSGHYAIAKPVESTYDCVDTTITSTSYPDVDFSLKLDYSNKKAILTITGAEPVELNYDAVPNAIKSIHCVTSKGQQRSFDLSNVTITATDSSATTTYTFKMGGKGVNTDYPDVTFDPSTTTSKTGTVTAKWNANEKYKAGQKVVTLQDGWFSDEDSYCTIPYDQISVDFVENTEPATELKPIPLGTKVAFGSAPTVTDEKTYKDMVNKNDEYTSDGYFQYYINQLDPTAIRVGINESTDNYIKFTPETDCYVDINFEDNDMVMTGDDDSSVDVFRSPKTAGDPITRTLYVQSGVTYTLKRTKLTESGNAYIHTMYFHDITTRLGVGNYTVENGKEITVNLATRGIKDDNLGIKDYDIMVVYDANKLTYESTESVPAELTISPDPSANAVNGVASMTGYEYIDIKANNSGTEALSNDVLAKIKFKAKAVGKAPVLVFVTSINATTEMPPYVVVDGSVTVSETAPTTGDNILKIAADNSVTRDNLQAIYNINPSDVTLFSRIVGTVGRNKNQLKNIDEVGITVVKTDDFEAWKNNGFADDSKILGNVAVDTVYKDVYNVSGNIADLNTGKENNEANTYFDSIVYADTSVDSNSLTACAYTVIQGVKSYYNKSGETSTVVITNN